MPQALASPMEEIWYLARSTGLPGVSRRPTPLRSLGITLLRSAVLKGSRRLASFLLMLCQVVVSELDPLAAGHSVASGQGPTIRPRPLSDALFFQKLVVAENARVVGLG